MDWLLSRASKLLLGSFVMCAITACQPVGETGPAVPVAVGDGVNLLKNSFACKSPIDELENMERIKIGLTSPSTGSLNNNPVCYPVNQFLVNGEWIVQQVSGNKLLVKMDGYVGDYWVSRAAVLATKSPRRVIPDNVASTPEFVRPTIDLKTVSLPANFTGNNPWQVFSALQGISLKQGPYEKKPEFQERLKKLTETEKIDGRKLSDYFAFEFKSNMPMGYNPDTEELSFHNYGTFLIESRDFDSGRWKEVYRKEGRNIGEEEQVIVQDAKVPRGSYYNYTSTLKLSPAEAQANQGKIKIFVVGKFVKPFIDDELDLPTEYRETKVYFKRKLIFSVDGLWMVNTETGKVLSKKFVTKKEF